MAQTVRDVMTESPVTVESSTSLQDLARLMRDNDTGAIIVLDNGTVTGIATDRDIAVRAVAEGKNPTKTTVADVCTSGVETIPPDATVDQAVQIMRTAAIRRLPVVEGSRAVGIVSLGDLAIERDSKSALADISKAPPNN